MSRLALLVTIALLPVDLQSTGNGTARRSPGPRCRGSAPSGNRKRVHENAQREGGQDVKSGKPNRPGVRGDQRRRVQRLNRPLRPNRRPISAPSYRSKGAAPRY
jgi:hypothetical protein